MAERKRFKADAVPSSSVGGGISIDQTVMRQTNDHTKVAKKRVLIDELGSATMRYHDLKANRIMLDEQMKEIKRQKRRIVAEEADLTDYCATRVKALEELLADSKDQEKKEAEFVISEMEATWANYIEKIVGESP